MDATTGIGGSSYATEAYVDQKLTERGPHFSGDYNDLTNSPTLFSGSFTDLNNKPTTNSWFAFKSVACQAQTWAIAIYACLLWMPMAVVASLYGIPFIEQYFNVSFSVAATIIISGFTLSTKHFVILLGFTYKVHVVDLVFGTP